ncbi:MAG TPA: isoprenylcysteine carboxylmethyltransferase family protein [Pyrinomonadaceae bacterium]|nr:isoprenylcysteine carboxylmethyltransferase family protein [Pyrinomonadaceae bacterium]
MTLTLELFPTIVFVIVMACWVAFAAIFVFRSTPAANNDKKKDGVSIFGVALQGLSYGIVWSVHRHAFSEMFPGWVLLNAFLNIVALAAAIGSVVLITKAVRTLGKEWSITARTVEDHKLATNGPYARVRHPIYTGMLGMLLATGIAISHWLALPVALLVFAAGTLIRIRIEERLLKETFGSQFDQYAKRVPAVIPGIF